MTFETPDRKYLKLLEWIPVDNIRWYWLSENTNAIHILEKNLDKVDWDALITINPNIFTYDYEAIKNAIYKEGGIAEELMQNRFHPKNMDKWDGWGFREDVINYIAE
jgi:hypothetical protein